MTDAYETIEYRDHTINVIHDDCPYDPIEDNDLNWSMLVKHDRSIKAYGPDISDPIDLFTDGQIIRHSRAICTAFGEFPEYMQDHVNDYRQDFGTMADCKRDFFTGLLDQTSDSDKFDTLESLYKILRIPVLNTCTTGYVQRDYADILIVALPAFAKEFGLRKSHDFDRDMKAQADLYGAYAWGDCFGYTITDATGNKLDDSCWGFFGTDHESSGLLEMAHNAIDCNCAHADKLASLAANVQICKGLGL